MGKSVQLYGAAPKCAVPPGQMRTKLRAARGLNFPQFYDICGHV